MEIKQNVVGWFEIPVSDMQRAVEFYNNLFGFELEASPFWENDEMAIFPTDFENFLPGAAGALYKGKDAKPGDTGPILFFTSPSGDCQNELDKAKEIGAKILTEKTKIPEDHGFFIILFDSEGNKIAVHSLE